MHSKRKNSGIEWIGEIPDTWAIQPISKMFKQRNTKVSDFEYAPLSVTKQGIVPQLDSAAKSDDHSNRKLVKKNDFVINSRSDRKMSSGVSQLDGSVSLINLVMKYDHDELYPSFVNYLMKNYGFAEEFYRWGTGIVADLWSTNWERCKKIQIPVTTIEEQKKIAKFLDEKTSKIDQIISDTKKSIEELNKYKQSIITEAVTKGLDPNAKMVPSGIEWIGDIPEGWKVGKLGNYVTVNGRIGYRGYTTEDIVDEGYGAISFSPSNIINSEVVDYKNTYISWDKYEESPEIQVNIGDVLYCKTGSSYGKAGLVAKLSQKSTINPQLVILKVKENAYSKFVNYLLSSSIGINQSEMIVGGSTMPTISQEKILKMMFPIASFEDQILISNYLDASIDKLDTIIKNKENIVLKYEELKKSLIYEYVTGKKQVK